MTSTNLVKVCKNHSTDAWNTRSSHRRRSIKNRFLKFRNIHRKTPLLEYLFDKACNSIKNRPQHKCFPVNIVTFLRIRDISSFLKNFCKQQLLRTNGWASGEKTRFRGCLHETSFRAKWNIFISVSGRFLITVYMTQPEMKLIAGVISLQSFWQKWNFILGDEIPWKHYPI